MSLLAMTAKSRLFPAADSISVAGMSTVTEVKTAVETLPPQERQELFRWLAGREDFQAVQLEELRRDLTVGLVQAERGELAPLDMSAIKAEFRRRLASESN